MVERTNAFRALHTQVLGKTEYRLGIGLQRQRGDQCLSVSHRVVAKTADRRAHRGLRKLRHQQQSTLMMNVSVVNDLPGAQPHQLRVGIALNDLFGKRGNVLSRQAGEYLNECLALRRKLESRQGMV